MNKETIEKIQSLTTSSQDIKPYNDRVIALPENVKLHDIENYSDSRSRFRGTFRTHCLEDFNNYISGAGELGQCFVDDQTMTATAILNFGAKNHYGHCDNLAILKMIKSSEFKEILDIDGSTFEQKEFAEWLEDYTNYIEPVNGSGEILNTGNTISSVRKIDFNKKVESTSEQQTFRTEKTSIEKIDTSSTTELPSFIDFECAPYLHLKNRKITLRVTLKSSHDKPRFSLRIIKRGLLLADIADEFKNYVTNGIDEPGLDVHLGTFAT